MTFRFRPLVDAHVTSPYGDSPGREDHGGTDYRAPVGTPLFAMGDGLVDRADDIDDSANGKNVVIIDDTDGRVTYLHMSSIARGIVGGARVSAGQFIGTSGVTGAARGPHLHLQWQPRFPSSSSTADIDPVVQLLAPPPAAPAEDGDPLQALLWLAGLAALGWGLKAFLTTSRRREAA